MLLNDLFKRLDDIIPFGCYRRTSVDLCRFCADCCTTRNELVTKCSNLYYDKKNNIFWCKKYYEKSSSCSVFICYNLRHFGLPRRDIRIMKKYVEVDGKIKVLPLSEKEMLRDCKILNGE